MVKVNLLDGGCRVRILEKSSQIVVRSCGKNGEKRSFRL